MVWTCFKKKQVMDENAWIMKQSMYEIEVD